MADFEHENRPRPETTEQKIVPEKTEQSLQAKERSPEDLQRTVTETGKKIVSGEQSISNTQAQLHEVRASLGLQDSSETPHSVQVAQERNAHLEKQKTAVEGELAQHGGIQEKTKDAANIEIDEEQKLKNELYDLDDQEKEIGKEFRTKISEMEQKKGGKLTPDERDNLSYQMFEDVRAKIRGTERKLDRAREEKQAKGATAGKQPQEQSGNKIEQVTTSESEDKKIDEKIHEFLKRNEVGRPTEQLVFSLQDREDQHFTQLAHPEQIQDLWSATKNLESLIEQKQLSIGDFENAYTRVGRIFEEMTNNAPPMSSMRDNPESLRTVIAQIKNIGEINNELVNHFGVLDESKDRSDTARLRATLDRTNEALNKKLNQVYRLLDAVEGYQSTRF